ncbi:CheC, inhibitor of MCP methylation [Syntrophobotulus glycolicus DSM 8271]|uniref:CheC, inhibitor of MCP methylation n=1 Tax=Syntrophobotulus glycolicus (strain DSM 8271 / FlGlyR) TaxID=645991 RepID=F0SZW6_SYNGF|nr:chemotaxis protein CheC [Syntrophobotulus glycolicus]ADY54977.1 CheC, inhibitor of MCP methylation [Syntrophobotulus glycolicus DSM 8271]
MELTAIQFEVLKEIGNIGSGHAATSLSDLLQARINMEVPKVLLVPLEKITEFLGDGDSVCVALYLRIEGEISGKAVFILSVQGAEEIARRLLSLSRPPELFHDEIAQSALKEVGNILVSSFVIAITQFTGVKLLPSVPAIAIDMTGAILDAILLEEGEMDDYTLLIDTKLTGLKDMEGKFLFIPNQGSLEILLGAFGV